MQKINKLQSKSAFVLILPDIRSAINVGSMFRTADGAGVSKVYLTGYTPRPTDKFDRIQKDIAKSALGAENIVPWEYKKSLLLLIANLKKQGFNIIALEQDPRAIDYRTVCSVLKKQQAQNIAMIVGPEVTGLARTVLAKCDIIIEIPMHGQKESLNVSVAAGIALFEILK
jgi:23S rRNA (guanosine2251-2'-O)-methyltransferase